MAEGTKTPINRESLVIRVGRKLGMGGFFTAIPPQAPVAQETQGRQYDYGTGFNIQTRPRQEETGNTSFAQLRQFADSYDLLRLVIAVLLKIWYCVELTI